MADLGQGNTPRSDYPGAIDTNTVQEVDSPSPSKTLITAAKIEDAYAAIINIETELGTDPAGTLTDVKTFLQTEHNTNGTHTSTGTGSFVRAASPTLTNPTLTNPTLSGTWGGGTMGSGTVPLARMKVDEQNAENPSTVTLTFGSVVTIIALPSMNVLTGDLIYVYGSALMDKGGTAGTSGLYINKESGTCVVSAYPSANANDLRNDAYHEANLLAFARQISGVFKVVSSGTLILRLRGFSNGSTGSVPAGDGSLYALVLRGT